MNKKPNYTVCHLLYEEYPRDPRIRRYVNALNENKIHSVVICSKKKHEKSFENLNNNLVYRIPVAKLRQSFLLTFIEYILFTLIAAGLLAYLGIKYRFKIIHVHTLPDTLIFAALPNKLFGTRLILDLHEIFPELFSARKPELKNSVWVKILKFSERISIRLADTVLTIHDNAKAIFVKRNKGTEEKIHVIMNGVDPVEFRDTELKPAGRFVIIYNGTINKILNLDMIIRAIALLKSKMQADDFNKIVFRLYGDGPVLNELLQLAKDLGINEKVEYMGFLPPDEMAKEVLKSSVLILPPLKNIYSDLFYTIKLVEMVYLRIPVIATRLNTYKTYYGEDSLFYFDSGSVEQLADSITEVFYNKELVKQKTENALRDYKKVEWEKMKTRYIEVVNNLLSK